MRGRERVRLMIKSHGKVMGKSWKFISRFLWELCEEQVEGRDLQLLEEYVKTLLPTGL